MRLLERSRWRNLINPPHTSADKERSILLARLTVVRFGQCLAQPWGSNCRRLWLIEREDRLGRPDRVLPVTKER